MAPAAPIVGHSAGFLAGLAWLNLAWLGLVGLIGFGLALLAYWLGLACSNFVWLFDLLIGFLAYLLIGLLA